jgi:hypothetical protein
MTHILCQGLTILDSVGNAKYFTTLDLKSGYWQIPVHPDDREKTAFVTHGGFVWGRSVGM